MPTKHGLEELSILDSWLIGYNTDFENRSCDASDVPWHTPTD